MIVRFHQFKTVKSLFKFDDYVLITTYSNGRRTSDGGQDAAMGHLYKVIFLTIVLFFLSIAIQPIREVIMIIHYGILSLRVAKRPPIFLRAWIFVIVLIASFAIGITVAFKTGNVTTRSSVKSLYQVGTTFTYGLEIKIYEEPDNKSTVVKTLNEGTKLTVAGDIVYKPKDSYPYIPVEINGVTGWVWSYLANVITGTATINANDVYYFDYNAAQVNGEYPKIFLPIGTKVEFMHKYKSKKTKEEVTYVLYNGRQLTLYGEGIQLDQ